MDESKSRNSAPKNIEITGDQFTMGKLPTDNDQDLPGMLAVAKATAEKVWPHTTDAQVWAAEFKKRFPAIDEGTMLGWFANAIMAGHDAASFAVSERPLIPEGWALVPVEPPMEMKLAMLSRLTGIEPDRGYTSHNEKRLQRAYHATLAAAPRYERGKP